MGEYLACFKAYDVRGKVPSELNPELAYDIGRAYADETGASQVCVGYDIRLSGPELCDSLVKGLTDAGVDVFDLGLVGTEMVYFATGHFEYGGGIMITASHNPPEYNGLKMVREGSRPISGDTGLFDIEKRTHEKKWERSGKGKVTRRNVYDDFVHHLTKVVDPEKLKELKVLACPGNGAAGPAMEALEANVPLNIFRMHFKPDGTFPNGVPNPILPESRADVEKEMAKNRYDMGVAWDGDYDRAFFFDENGSFIEGYYIVGLLAEAILADQPGEAIIYDPRLTWNTIEIVEEAGGRPVVCKSGHAFIKEKMRAENAVYGGEMSAHHYFREHWYCDSGMIPMLLIAKLLSESGKSLGELVADRIARYPCSGEINSTVANALATIEQVAQKYSDGEQDRIDGLSVEYADWRFNLRPSNTEPLLRLNVETRGDRALLEEKTGELLDLIRA